MNILRLAILLLCIAACTTKPSLPYYHTPDFMPHWTDRESFNPDTIHRIARFQFTDQHGKIFSSDSVRSRIYIANFFFTSCPGICPRTTANLSSVVDAFTDSDEPMVLSHTVMPWADSVVSLQGFALNHKLDYRRWRLLTGKVSEIYSLARTSYFAEELAGYKRDSTEFVHTEHCLLIDRQGHIRGIYKGTLPLEMDRLREDIRLLLSE